MPDPASRSFLTRALRRAYGLAAMNLGRAGASAPLSLDYGFDRGKPIDRYYIERFLMAHAGDIRGRVLEMSESLYSKTIGGSGVSQHEILDLDAGNVDATIIGDLTKEGALPASAFDCMIITQTLQFIFELEVAVAELRRGLKPGGTLLLTVPGITPVNRGGWTAYWSLTEESLKRLLGRSFDPAKTRVQSYGNLYAATAFLHGAAVQETRRSKLDMFDPAYPVIVAARAEA